LPIELMIENKEMIVLDGANNVFVGPDDYFKIVIDDFDGKSIKAWHLEDSTGHKTGNLTRGERIHIDVLVNANCRTVWHFAARVAPELFVQEQSHMAELEAQIQRLRDRLAEPQQ
jgi:hypothetical protein